jgi:hypothetical protein
MRLLRVLCGKNNRNRIAIGITKKERKDKYIRGDNRIVTLFKIKFTFL